MLIPPRELNGWKVTSRRRHRLDQTRQGRKALCHQSRSGLLRSGTRHQREEQPERDGHHFKEHHLHKRGYYSRRRRVVGRNVQGPARQPYRLAWTSMGS
jgi:hypothetical protein